MAKGKGDFPQEFGFLPPELLFKADQFILAYHNARGSGWLFVHKSHIRAESSPYLLNLERLAVWRGRLMRVAALCTVALAVCGILWSNWLIAPGVVFAIVTLYLYRLVGAGLVQERALIVAMEMLASDYAGWGTCFPDEKQRAELWLSSIGFDTTTKLLDAYPPLARPEIAKSFQPSTR